MTNLADLLPEDFPNRESLVEQFGTVDKLAKSYQEARSAISSSVRAPITSEDPGEWAKFYRKLGAPEEAEAYTVPGGDERFKALVEQLRGPAKDAGLTTKQWDQIFGKAAEAYSADLERVASVQETWLSEAKKKWGNDFDAKKEIAESTLEDVFPDEKVVEGLKAAGLHLNPAFMEGLLTLNEARSDDSVPGGTGGANLGPDYMGIAAEIRKLMAEGVYSDARHPQFEEAMGKFIAATKVLEEGGFEGPDDPRLMPSWYPK